MSSSVVVSMATHAVLIAAAVAGTHRSDTLEPDWIENRAYYLPPPNRVPSQDDSRETIEYVELAPEEFGTGSTQKRVGGDESIFIAPSASLGDIGRDLTNSIEAPKLSGGDSIFTELEVDSTVARYPGSAAPIYPADMLKQGLQGSVLTQYVVDTTGYPDTTSLKILRATHEDFVEAVRIALPYMRFVPAKIGPRRVRQLVQQEFSFKIDKPTIQEQPRSTSTGRRPSSSSVDPTWKWRRILKAQTPLPVDLGGARKPFREPSRGIKRWSPL